jgi:hypothetical protein
MLFSTEALGINLVGGLGRGRPCGDPITDLLVQENLQMAFNFDVCKRKLVFRQQ